MRKILPFILGLVCCGIAPILHAQPTAATYRLSDQQQLWHQTRNAAGMAFDMDTSDSSHNRGIAYFDFLHEEGDYHRIQDGGMRNSLRFFTERYQKIGRYLYGYGLFDFNMGRTKQRAWSDVLRSYDADPFISGSSVFGKYDHQDFTLNASLSSVQLGRWTYGAGLYYKVGDLSRLRDPRSRINLLDYRITPSATFDMGAGHYSGLALHYDRRKEKLTGLTTVQTDPNLKYYVMTGLENATGTIGGYQGYMREYVNHEFGGELSYGYRGTALHSVTAVTLDHGTEYIYGTNKYEPGRYYTYRYGLSSQNRLRCGNLLHTWDAAISYEQAYADEYRQERISQTDGQTGYTSVHWQTTMEYRKRYQLKQLQLDARYRLTLTEGDCQKGYLGVRYALRRVDNKRLLPVSKLIHGGSDFTLEGGIALFGQRFLVDAEAGYHAAGTTDLVLADATTEFATAVLLPDVTVLDANYFRGRLQLEYQQPIPVKDRMTQWFVRCYGQYLGAQHSLSRSVIAVSIGMYY